MLVKLPSDVFFPLGDFFSRFQDDLYGVHAPYLPMAIYLEEPFPIPNLGLFNGIYPQQFLKIDREQGQCGGLNSPIHHQDLSIVLRSKWSDKDHALSFFLCCSLYSKQEALAKMGVQFIFYPAVSSALSNQCKYGIVFSHCHRLLSRCSYKADFILAVQDLMRKLHEKPGGGYKLSRMLKYYQRFLQQYQSSLLQRFSAKPVALAVPVISFLRDLRNLRKNESMEE